MTPLFFAHIQPQLDEQIAYELVGYSPAELNDILDNATWWNKTRPFSQMRVHHGEADLTFTEWIHACEAMTNNAVSGVFNANLVKHIKATIDAQYEVRMKDLEDDYREEAKEVAA